MFGGSGSRLKAGLGIGGSTPNTDLETKYGVAKKAPESCVEVSFSPLQPGDIRAKKIDNRFNGLPGTSFQRVENAAI